MPTGGEALVSALATLGVEVVFGLPGVHNLAAWTAFSGSPVRLVGVRHEQTAGYAADGWARATGRLGVALTTTGPGAANAVTATGEAWAAHSPLLVIATDIPSTLRRPGAYRGVLHETTDQAGLFRPITKQQVRVERAEQLWSAVVAAATVAMTSPRRPVYLEVPTDLLSAQVPGPPGALPAAAAAAPVDDGPAQAAARLRELARPLIWAGGGATADEAGPLVAEL
ncbi:MAG: thiamine pyrophosphate protein binding domain protein, partial [Frankiales bacterium]|nr:thiamine pyrophosphate protein binding domain protein [Frankiales bacterium]